MCRVKPDPSRGHILILLVRLSQRGRSLFLASVSASLSLSLSRSITPPSSFCPSLSVCVLWCFCHPSPQPHLIFFCFFFKSFSVPVSSSLLLLFFSADGSQLLFFPTSHSVTFPPVPSRLVLNCSAPSSAELLSSAPPYSCVLCPH